MATNTKETWIKRVNRNDKRQKNRHKKARALSRKTQRSVAEGKTVHV